MGSSAASAYASRRLAAGGHAPSGADKRQEEHAKAPQPAAAAAAESHPGVLCSGPQRRPARSGGAGVGLGAAGGQRRSEPLVDGDRGPLPAQLILSLINYNLIYNSKEIRQ